MPENQNNVNDRPARKERFWECVAGVRRKNQDVDPVELQEDVEKAIAEVKADRRQNHDSAN